MTHDGTRLVAAARMLTRLDRIAARAREPSWPDVLRCLRTGLRLHGAWWRWERREVYQQALDRHVRMAVWP